MARTVQIQEEGLRMEAGRWGSNVRPAATIVIALCLAGTSPLRRDRTACFAQEFVRGDVNVDTVISISDAIGLLEYLFIRKPVVLRCDDAGDVNDDSRIDISDPLYLLFYLLAGGDSPPAPTSCGVDPTEDLLACSSYEPCGWPRVKTNSIGIKLIFLPPGRFLMGSPEAERGRSPDEVQHPVNISCGFYMSDTEITQAQYKAVMGVNPSWWNRFRDGADHGINLRPVDSVTWFDAKKFCERLSFKEGRRYRLPTEAEWEYACRAGTTTRFSFGDALECLDGDGPFVCGGPCVSIDPYLWWCSNSGIPRAVAQKLANPWGLHDLHGNIAEWCHDWYGPYPTRAVSDPQGPKTGISRIVRGFGNLLLREDRCAARSHDIPNNYGTNVGFRIVEPVCPDPKVSLAD